MALQPGRNLLLEELAQHTDVIRAPRTADLAADFRRLSRLRHNEDWVSDPEPFASLRRVLRRVDEPPMDGVETSDNLCRLWAGGVVRSRVAAQRDAEAVDLAVRYRMVTALTGAVVLENQQQYQRHGLDPKADAAVGHVPGADPVPEPETWLLIVSGLGLLWFRGRRR